MNTLPYLEKNTIKNVKKTMEQREQIRKDVLIVTSLIQKYDISNLYPISVKIEQTSREGLLSSIFELNGINRMLSEYDCKFSLFGREHSTGKCIYGLQYDAFYRPGDDELPTYYDFIKDHISAEERHQFDLKIQLEFQVHESFNHFMKELMTYDLFDMVSDSEYIGNHVPLGTLDDNTNIRRYITSHSDVIPNRLGMIIFVYLSKRVNNDMLHAMKLLMNDEIIV